MQKPSIKENKKSIQNINIRINPIVNFKKVGGLLILKKIYIYIS